jgi:hypothetical protein
MGLAILGIIFLPTNALSQIMLLTGLLQQEVGDDEEGCLLDNNDMGGECYGNLRHTLCDP